MENIEELYGLLVVYYGLTIACSKSSKEESYLRECAIATIAQIDSDTLLKGLNRSQPCKVLLKNQANLTLTAKFMEAVERHLICLEDEVPETQKSELCILETKRKRKKRYAGIDAHKKSIILNHLKSSTRSEVPNIEKISYQNIFKRKPRNNIPS